MPLSEDNAPSAPHEEGVDHDAPVDARRFRPWPFFGVLLAPAIISLLLTPALFAGALGALQAGLVLQSIASIAAGAWCGIHFTHAQFSLKGGVKVAVGIVSVIGCIGVAWALAYGGCMAFGILLYQSA